MKNKTYIIIGVLILLTFWLYFNFGNSEKNLTNVPEKKTEASNPSTIAPDSSENIIDTPETPIENAPPPPVANKPHNKITTSPEANKIKPKDNTQLKITVKPKLPHPPMDTSRPPPQIMKTPDQFPPDNGTPPPGSTTQ